MLSKKLKKVILGFVTALCLTGSAMPVMADTVRFNVTVPGDPKSKRIPKSDDEQKFYVTGTAVMEHCRVDHISWRISMSFPRRRILAVLHQAIRENIKAGQNLMYIISCHHIRV